MGFYSRQMTGMLSIPRNEWVVTKDDLKEYWKDKSEWNEIFDELVLPEEYDHAICRAVMRFNSSPPYSSWSPKSFPQRHAYLLMSLSMIEVLRDVVLYKIKNLLQGNNSGIEVSIHNNAPLLSNFLASLEANVITELKTIKGRQNINEANGSIFAIPPNFPIF